MEDRPFLRRNGLDEGLADVSRETLDRLLRLGALTSAPKGIFVHHELTRRFPHWATDVVLTTESSGQSTSPPQPVAEWTSPNAPRRARGADFARSHWSGMCSS